MADSREFKQQELLESVLSGMHRFTREHEDYVEVFVDIAEQLLRLSMGELLEEKALIYADLLKPIQDFTENGAEQRMLYGRLLEKIVSGSLMPRLYAKYRDTVYHRH